MNSPNLLTPRQAAERLGMSYPALKHWILAGRIETIKTPGGHHRIPADALSKFLPATQALAAGPRISGRNQLVGTVMQVKIEGLLAKVVLAVGEQRVTSIITADAARELALKKGDTAAALIKRYRRDDYPAIKAGNMASHWKPEDSAREMNLSTSEMSDFMRYLRCNPLKSFMSRSSQFWRADVFPSSIPLLVVPVCCSRCRHNPVRNSTYNPFRQILDRSLARPRLRYAGCAASLDDTAGAVSQTFLFWRKYEQGEAGFCGGEWIGRYCFPVKYRILAANEQHGNYILTAFLGWSIPTGTYQNGQVTGANSATITPTVAYGKGFGNFDAQGTFGVQIPAHDELANGTNYVWNNTLQYRVVKKIWPEIEFNTTHYQDGEHAGDTLNYITPGFVLGRFKLAHRVGMSIGGCFQIATTQFYRNNHNGIFTVRFPF